MSHENISHNICCGSSSYPPTYTIPQTTLFTMPAAQPSHSTPNSHDSDKGPDRWQSRMMKMKMSCSDHRYHHLNNNNKPLATTTAILTSDVQAQAQSPELAQASPGKPGQARAMLRASGSLWLRPQFCEAQALGLSHGFESSVWV